MSSPEFGIGLFSTLRDQLKATNNPNDLERAAIIDAMLQGRGQDLIYHPLNTVKRVRYKGVVALDGARVRQLRIDINMSQAELAEVVKLSEGYLSQIENQKRDRVSFAAGERIAKALEVNTTDLR